MSENESTDSNATEQNERKRAFENSGANIIWRNASKYGSLHDSFFHYVQKRTKIAIESVKLWFPELADQFDFSRLEIHSHDFFTQTLGKKSLDLLYTVPLRDGSATIPIALILEHKAQSSRLTNAATLAQTLGYAAAYCQELVGKSQAQRRKDAEEDGADERTEETSDNSVEKRVAQPIVIVIYTGKDVELTKLDWNDSYYLPESLSRFVIGFSPLFLNMTRLCARHEFNAPPFLQVAYNLMALASLGKLEGAEHFVAAPLSKVDEWGEEENDFVMAMASYFMQSSVNAKIKVDKSTLDVFFDTTKHRSDTMANNVWEAIGEQMRANEREEAVEEGREEGREILRSEISQTVANRFNERSSDLNALIKRVSDMKQLSSILLFASSSAKSTDEVTGYVSALL